MITLLSPAKSLNYEPVKVKKSSKAIFEQQTEQLVKIMSKKSKKDLMKLMSISEKIAMLNVDRYKNFDNQEEKQAILAFSGDVYQGFDAGSLNARDLDFANKHIRILSGLYGVLRPLDMIKPYPLEMGTRLKYRSKTNLYQIWGDQLLDHLNTEMKEKKHKAIINLASKEYFKSIKAKMLNYPIYEINFKEMRNGKLTFVSFNAKKARGIMARYIVDQRITDPNQLVQFEREDYKFEASLSEDHQFTFVR